MNSDFYAYKTFLHSNRTEYVCVCIPPIHARFGRISIYILRIYINILVPGVDECRCSREAPRGSCTVSSFSSAFVCTFCVVPHAPLLLVDPCFLPIIALPDKISLEAALRTSKEAAAAATATAAELRKELAGRPTVSEVKALRQQLRVWQQLEFNADNEDDDDVSVCSCYLIVRHPGFAVL